LNLTIFFQQDTLLNVFLAIAVDNLANAQELTAAEEAAAAEAALKVSAYTSFLYVSLISFNIAQHLPKLSRQKPG